MYISKLVVKNYKSIKDETFKFNKGINVLVGKNNAGKSNIVSALNEILGDRYNTTSYEDKIFYYNGKENLIRNFKIIAEIDEINNLDYSLLENIKKSIGLIDISNYFNEEENDFDSEWLLNDDDELKEKYPELFNNYKGTNLLVWKKKEDLKVIFDNTKKIWIYKYYNKDEDINLYNIIIKEEKSMRPLFPNEKVDKYYRMLYINPNIKATLMTSLLIPAFRSTESTLRIAKWTWYGKLLQKKWEDSCNLEHQEAIQQASNKLKETIGKVYAELKDDINMQLEKTLTLMNVKIDINMLESKSEDYYKNIKLSVNDGIETPLENKGSGLQSLIMIELFKFYCKVFNQSSLLILEEPELFLHPHAKRMLSDILNDFIEDNKNQIIITTHSEEFIHNIDIENINVIRKTENGTKKSRINKEDYGDGKELQKLKIELQHKNTEMFFAEKVILVEGEEQILIPEIVKKIYGKNILNNNDISVIKVGGKSYFDIYRRVLNELGIENYIIADYDIINRGIDSLLEEKERNKLSEIRGKIQEKLKSNKKIKKEMESRDWESLVKILDNIIKEKKYNDALDEIWTTFKDRIYEKNKLEDYYKKDNFGEEFSKISGKGIIAYKIAELASNYGVDKYIEIEEYKKILSNIIKIN